MLLLFPLLFSQSFSETKWSLDDFPNEKTLRGLAMYGVNVQRRGELRTYDSFFDQIIMITLPSEQDYRQIIDAIYAHCASLDVERFYTYGIDPNQPGTEVNHTLSEMYRNKIVTDCKNFYSTAKRVTKEMLTSAFSETLPQPRLTPSESQQMISGYYEENLDLKVRAPVNRFRISALSPNQPTSYIPKLSIDVSSEPPTVLPDVAGNSTDAEPLAERSTDTPADTTVSPAIQLLELSSTPTAIPSILNSSIHSNIVNTHSFSSGAIYTNPNTLLRKKRFVITATVIGAIVGLLSVSFATTGLALYNQQKINALNRQVVQLVNKQKEADLDAAALADSMLGFIELDESKTNGSNSHLNEFLRIQQLFTAHVRHSTHVINTLSRGDAVQGGVLLSLIENMDLTNRVQTLLDSARQRITDYSMGLLSLHNNQLSAQFVPYNKLRQILFFVRRNLPDGYTLGIPLTEIERYYYSKLVRFSRVQNQLIIRLSIPLTREPIVLAKSLYQPIFNPFPLPVSWSKQHSMEFYRIYEPLNDMWLFNSNKFSEIVSRKHIQCHEAGNYLDCVRFRPSPVIPQTRCLAALMCGHHRPLEIFGAENNTVCETYHVSHKAYTPIFLDESLVCIHGSTRLNYQVRCPGQKDVDIDLAEDKGSDCISIQPSCVLQVNEFTFAGPPQQMNRTFGYELPGSPGLLITTNSSNRIILPGNIEIPDLIANITAVRVKVVNRDQGKIDEIVRKIKRSAENIAQRVNASDQIIKESFHDTSKMGLLLAIENTLFKAISFYLLFTFIRGNTILELGSPSLTILTGHTLAFPYDDILGQVLSESYTDFMIENVTSLLWIFAIVLSVSAYFSRSLFYRAYASNHYGRKRGVTNEYVLMISVGLKTHSFYSIMFETITLEFPINTKRMKELGCIDFTTMTKICTFETDGRGQFSLTQKVVGRGRIQDSSSCLKIHPEVVFDLSTLQWENNAEPSILSNSVVDFCYVDFARNPQLAISAESVL